MAHGCNLGIYANGAADLGRHLRTAQADRRLASDRGGPAERPGGIGERDRGPRHLFTLGRRQDRGKRRAALLAAAQDPPADLQHPIQRLRPGILHFLADNYAPFYNLPIECTDRDAAFVLDGLLYNESELEIEEHYTDTHGYTEINFAAFAMLGLRFCPRIRGVQHQRIYRIDHNYDYGLLTSLVRRADQTIDTEQIAEQWDRMGHALRLAQDRPRHSLSGPETAGRLQRQEPFLSRQSGSRAHLQHRVHPPVPLGAGIAQPDPARLAQSRATSRLGQGRLLRAAGSD